MKRLLLILILVMGWIFSWAQIERGLILDLDTQHIMIGDQIKMTVEMRGHVKDQISFPQIGDTLSKDVEVVSKSFPDTTYGSSLEQLIIRQEVLLTAWDSGLYTVKPIHGLINGDSAFAPPFMIGVYTFQIDTIKGITDIKANIEVPLTFMDYFEAYWPYLAGLYGFGLLVTLVVIAVRHFTKKPVVVVEQKAQIAAHDLAFQRLKNLENKQLWQNGKYKEYHVRLSEILREYLENRYDILALEQTTDEILADLRPRGIGEENRLRIQELLQFMDLVKFAKQQPLANENESAMVSARVIIESTRAIEEEEEDRDENQENNLS